MSDDNLKWEAANEVLLEVGKQLEKGYTLDHDIKYYDPDCEIACAALTVVDGDTRDYGTWGYTLHHRHQSDYDRYRIAAALLISAMAVIKAKEAEHDA